MANAAAVVGHQQPQPPPPPPVLSVGDLVRLRQEINTVWDTTRGDDASSANSRLMAIAARSPTHAVEVERSVRTYRYARTLSPMSLAWRRLLNICKIWGEIILATVGLFYVIVGICNLDLGEVLQSLACLLLGLVLAALPSPTGPPPPRRHDQQQQQRTFDPMGALGMLVLAVILCIVGGMFGAMVVIGHRLLAYLMGW